MRGGQEKTQPGVSMERLDHKPLPRCRWYNKVGHHMHFIYYYVAASKAQCSFFQSLDRSHQIYMLFEKYKQEPLSFVPYNYVLYISARTLGLTARKLVFREFSDSECVRTLPIGTRQWVAPVHCC